MCNCIMPYRISLALPDFQKSELSSCSGERDPSVLIQYRDVRCKKTPEILQQALTGNWQPEYLFALELSVVFSVFTRKRSVCVMIKSVVHYCSSAPELKSRKAYCPLPNIVQSNPIRFPLMSDQLQGRIVYWGAVHHREDYQQAQH
ncbi:Uncharacterised protein [Salmonella enterica]|uniref:Uncharacterized protein n=1 Tax=Salmonella enterica TaxID=28901 RepID=A0A379QD30_SALER|nr:Uncharacterised protein [Salmonella enterica]